MVKKIQLALLPLLFSFALFGTAVSAFELDGTKWFRAKAEFHVGISGFSATQIAWNVAFESAMDEWSEKTLFEFTAIADNKDPCQNDGFSSVDFKEDFCGSSFGSNVLAVAVRRFEPQILGPPNIVEADIVINEEEDFDIFDGPLVQFGQNFNGVDFRRVALHELGHTIGLDHEETEDAIMAPKISNLFQLQADDIAGINTLYTGLSNCEINTLTFGTFSESLDVSDCTVKELTVGGSDESRIDIYRFDLQDTTDLEFKATSTNLDAVLVLATTELQYLDVDTATSDDCDSVLNASLQAGSYFLMVNTFDEQIKEECGVQGSYALSANFSSAKNPTLGSNASLAGTQNLAGFSGGISANDGVSFGNVFRPTDALDITAEIAIDSRHQGQAGFLVVAVLIGDQVLMLNSQGQFSDVSSSPLPAIPFAQKTLEATESLSIANDLIPAEVGIQEIEANIVVGYGLASNPTDIFYHTRPLNLIVAP